MSGKVSVLRCWFAEIYYSLYFNQKQRTWVGIFERLPLQSTVFPNCTSVGLRQHLIMDQSSAEKENTGLTWEIWENSERVGCKGMNKELLVMDTVRNTVV